MKRLFLVLFALSTAAMAAGQSMRELIAKDPNLAAGIYTAYPVTEQIATPAPKGYKPFYISHYGRHGSRYQTKEEKYQTPRMILERAEKDGRLTTFGLDVLRRVRILAQDALLRAGDLSSLGEKEHKGIAERMVKYYPQVFSAKNGNHISCFSTQSVRCVMSMAAFSERLKELNPKLDITRQASVRHFHFTRPDRGLNTIHDTARAIAKDYQKRHTDDKAYILRIFNDYDYAANLIREAYKSDSTYDFMGNMHDLAMIIQNYDHLTLSLHDLFTEEERYQMWSFFNIRRYLTYGPSVDYGDIRIADAKPLLRDIIERADDIISGKTKNEIATLRFGHDSYIIPLLALMHVEGCDGRIPFSQIEKLPEVWCDSKITSMSVNMQFVFFRNKKGDVLVKLMHSEREVRIPLKTDTFPFYKWEDFKNYCASLYSDCAAFGY